MHEEEGLHYAESAVRAEDRSEKPPFSLDRAIPADTTRDAFVAQLEALRRKTPGQRLRMSLDLSEAAKRRVVAGVRQRHPAYDEQEVFAATSQIWLGGEWSQSVAGEKGMDSMMDEDDQERLLEEVIRTLSNAGVPHMLCGSHASGVWGQPRSTVDVDVVIDPGATQLEQWLKLIPQNWYLSAETARAALAERGMFNVVDTATGEKADLIVRKNRPFSRSEFERRARVDAGGFQVDVAQPEDVILAKLEWAAATSSQRQHADALAVAVANRDSLDWSYMERWSRELGVGEGLELLRKTAEQAEGS